MKPYRLLFSLLGMVMFFGSCVTSTANCNTACSHGLALGCEWSAPTPQGHACVEVCTNASQTVPWDVSSLTSATACSPSGTSGLDPYPPPSTPLASRGLATPDLPTRASLAPSQ
jgi:hypothetical protein